MNNTEKKTLQELIAENDTIDNICVYDIIKNFNRGSFRKNSIPQELVSGWPSIIRLGKNVCLRVPYYMRKIVGKKAELYPIYCTVTFPVTNPDRILDFTVYAYKKEWEKVDYTKPVCVFDENTLGEVENAQHYRELTEQLYGCYDSMIKDVMNNVVPFSKEKEMKELFAKLVEPEMKKLYLAVNNKFYSYLLD